ncbi:MAG: alpha/beta hydrolase [Deltaproteobacteria bacterium]|nr:alpha/beta hydrolase [Deltaproteobacteria bacterium]
MFKHSSGAMTNYRVQQRGTQRGRNAIFIQGMLSSSYVCFSEIVDHFLDAGYRVVQYDLWGRGRSSMAPGNRYDSAALRCQLMELLSHVGIGEHHNVLVGYSLGSGIAAFSSDSNRNIFSHIIFVGPIGVCCRVPIRLPNWISEFLLRYFYGLVRKIHIMVAEWATRVEFVDVGSNKAIIQWIAANIRLHANRGREFYLALHNTTRQFPFNDMKQLYKKISERKSPRLMVMLSEKDKKIPFEKNYRFFKHLFYGTSHLLVAIPGAGHWMLIERSHEVAGQMLSFCNGHSHTAYD